MIRWDEFAFDVLAIVLVAVGVGLWFLPAGLIAGGIGLMILSVGLKARRGNLQGPYRGREVNE